MLHGASYHYGQHLLVESNAKEELLSESDIDSGDSDAVVSLWRRHLTNILQVGAYLIIHLLWIGIA